ncbi:hypothetical protein P775_18490 [Puniceibacterium antarcticum]|uniref:Uncharacterized protein n=1 Tax=Puniceibacterium antarcticum TaxID=1206336 RepID=A0A2G8RAN9_9RHOB|nr:hypothetical protein [Puniceibacterium antarcticum]PIL18563.1 hypothetical protein P775_18490 [Puniceibacterium antarcticum]
MSRKFITTLLAAAVALTGLTAAPAWAANNDALLRTLGIGTGLLIVGAAIKNANDHDKRKEKDRREERDRNDVPFGSAGNFGHHNQGNGYGHDNRGGGFGHDKRGGKFDRYREPLPGRCLIETRDGPRAFEAHCLSKRYSDSNKLPDFCRSKVRTRQGRVSAYDARCLSNSGFEIARR